MKSFREFFAEGDVVDFGKAKDAKGLKDFHKEFMKRIKTKSQETHDKIQKMHDEGKFPMKVGDRFTTQHSRDRGLPPSTVLGYHVGRKNHEKNYGYYVKHGDGTTTLHMIRSEPLEKLHGPKKWKEIQAGVRHYTGPK